MGIRRVDSGVPNQVEMRRSFSRAERNREDGYLSRHWACRIKSRCVGAFLEQRGIAKTGVRRVDSGVPSRDAWSFSRKERIAKTRGCRGEDRDSSRSRCTKAFSRKEEELSRCVRAFLERRGIVKTRIRSRQWRAESRCVRAFLEKRRVAKFCC